MQKSKRVVEIKEVDDLTKIHQKAKEARLYALNHGMNLRFCFLLDFSYDLYTRRFFVYDLVDSRVLETSLVSHGHGKGNTVDRVVFSNEIGSNCSSLGKYRVGERAYSQRGVHFHYKLHGLESTNSNAFQRSVVLHSFEYFGCDSPCLVSEGCAIVCDDMMLYLDGLLQSEKNPTLLWIFN
ncbi:MAG: murein L,D-transpeptidase catalytic domain family protein [Paludibacteraceae bacterium]|nr:murein L,D-transpeptidase catalytic domain family protein [Paludibacteraceae bacterium]